MDAVCLEANDAAHYIPAWSASGVSMRGKMGCGIFLVHDGGPSHAAGATAEYLAEGDDWWRPRLTPAHASWMNQSELLNHAFDMRYLRRGSWASRTAYAAHVVTSSREYNRNYADLFEWTWTNQKMRRWFSEHAT